jgi:hypothetical protein
LFSLTPILSLSFSIYLSIYLSYFPLFLSLSLYPFPLYRASLSFTFILLFLSYSLSTLSSYMNILTNLRIYWQPGCTIFQTCSETGWFLDGWENLHF